MAMQDPLSAEQSVDDIILPAYLYISLLCVHAPISWVARASGVLLSSCKMISGSNWMSFIVCFTKFHYHCTCVSQKISQPNQLLGYMTCSVIQFMYHACVTAKNQQTFTIQYVNSVYIHYSTAGPYTYYVEVFIIFVVMEDRASKSPQTTTVFI